MWKTCISTRTWTRVFGISFQCLCLLNICWMFVEYMISDSSFVNWIFAEGLSNIWLMSVECLINVCWISDRYVRHFLCELNISWMSIEYLMNVCKYLSNVCQIYENFIRHFLCQPNLHQMSVKIPKECLSNVCWRPGKYLTNMSDNSYVSFECLLNIWWMSVLSDISRVNRISAECRSNIIMMNVCWISVAYLPNISIECLTTISDTSYANEISMSTEYLPVCLFTLVFMLDCSAGVLLLRR